MRNSIEDNIITSLNKENNYHGFRENEIIKSYGPNTIKIFGYSNTPNFFTNSIKSLLAEEFNYHISKENEILQSFESAIIKLYNLDNPVNFIKFITDQKIKKLTNGQLKTFLQFINKKHISSINYWERQTGYSTLIAIFILYSMIIKNKKVVLIESTDRQSIDIRELVFKFYRNIYDNLDCCNISSDLLYQKLFNSGNLILVNSNNRNIIRGLNPDIIIIENIEYMNNNINYLLELIRPIKNVLPAFQLIISSAIKSHEFINPQFLYPYSIVKNYNTLGGSNIWEMN